MKSRQLFFATGVLLGALAIGLTAVRFADESKALIEPLTASTLSLNNGWDFEIRNENESSSPAVPDASWKCPDVRTRPGRVRDPSGHFPNKIIFLFKMR